MYKKLNLSQLTLPMETKIRRQSQQKLPSYSISTLELLNILNLVIKLPKFVKFSLKF